MRFEVKLPNQDEVTTIDTGTDDLVESVDNLARMLDVRDTLKLHYLLEAAREVLR